MHKKILDMQYENLLKIFKPKYGNPDHIKIYNLAKEVSKKEESLQRTIERGKDGRKMLEKITNLKERAVYLLERDRQHLIS